MKNYFIEHKKQYEDQLQHVREANNGASTSIGPSFLLNAGATPNLDDILNSLPSKDMVDKLIDTYFEQYDSLIREYSAACP